jgi:hypothetical protein
MIGFVSAGAANPERIRTLPRKHKFIRWNNLRSGVRGIRPSGLIAYLGRAPSISRIPEIWLSSGQALVVHSGIFVTTSSSEVPWVGLLRQGQGIRSDASQNGFLW